MLISGGVDSSVALQLLKEQGHDLTAYYLKIWLEDELTYLGECPWEEDLSFCEVVCKKLNVPLKVISMQKEYWDNVVEYTISEAKKGRTPNPDIFCNLRVKFGAFFKAIDDSFDKVATGHYAQVQETEHRIQNTEKKGQKASVSCVLCPVSYVLRRAPDPIKDQTYFLAHLDQTQLSRAMFPIGHLKKEEVRKLAKKYDLANKDRKDSQGICFLGKISFPEFLKHHLGEEKGEFRDKETGEVVGEHSGYWFYTIGQRQGLGLSGGPWFVVDKDVEKNIVYLANGRDPKEVYKTEFEVEKIHWINPQLRITNYELRVKIRHGAAMYSCVLNVKKDGTGHVKLDEKVHGVASGQFAVFYDDDICLGCAKIT